MRKYPTSGYHTKREVLAVLTVAKLIDQLSKLPRDAEVIVIEPGNISPDGDKYYSEIKRVSFHKRAGESYAVQRENVVVLRLKSWF